MPAKSYGIIARSALPPQPARRQDLGSPNSSSRTRLVSDSASDTSGPIPRKPPSCTPRPPGIKKAAAHLCSRKQPVNRLADTSGPNYDKEGRAVAASQKASPGNGTHNEWYKVIQVRSESLFQMRWVQGSSKSAQISVFPEPSNGIAQGLIYRPRIIAEFAPCPLR